MPFILFLFVWTINFLINNTYFYVYYYHLILILLIDNIYRIKRALNLSVRIIAKVMLRFLSNEKAWQYLSCFLITLNKNHGFTLNHSTWKQRIKKPLSSLETNVSLYHTASLFHSVVYSYWGQQIKRNNSVMEYTRPNANRWDSRTVQNRVTIILFDATLLWNN